jgi:hypothetical protein
VPKCAISLQCTWVRFAPKCTILKNEALSLKGDIPVHSFMVRSISAHISRHPVHPSMSSPSLPISNFTEIYSTASQWPPQRPTTTRTSLHMPEPGLQDRLHLNLICHQRATLIWNRIRTSVLSRSRTLLRSSLNTTRHHQKARGVEQNNINRVSKRERWLRAYRWKVAAREADKRGLPKSVKFQHHDPDNCLERAGFMVRSGHTILL